MFKLICHFKNESEIWYTFLKNIYSRYSFYFSIHHIFFVTDFLLDNLDQYMPYFNFLSKQ